MQTNIKCITKGRNAIGQATVCVDCTHSSFEPRDVRPNHTQLQALFAGKGGCHG